MISAKLIMWEFFPHFFWITIGLADRLRSRFSEARGNSLRSAIPPELRRSIAYIAGRLIIGRPSAHIYDFSAAGYTHFSGFVEPEVQIYDHSADTQITGSPQSLYYPALARHVILKIERHKFNGYEAGSGSRFKGRIRQSAISLYDCTVDNCFHYLLA
jgi:hypothetical protein